VISTSNMSISLPLNRRKLFHVSRQIEMWRLACSSPTYRAHFCSGVAQTGQNPGSECLTMWHITRDPSEPDCRLVRSV